MQTNNRLRSCRAWLQDNGYQALIVPTNDPHFSEYVADHWRCRAWLSGFDGSAGTAIVSADAAIVSVDSRYFLQAERQLHPGFAVLRQQVAHAPEHLDWLIEHLPAGSTIATDGRLCSASSLEKINARCTAHDLALQTCADPFADLWPDRPPLPNADLFALDLAYAGVDRGDKLQALRAVLADAALLVTALDEIAWLLNLRGADVPYNPVFHAWLIVAPDQAILCCDNPMPSSVRDALAASGVALRPYADIEAIVTAQKAPLCADLEQLPANLAATADFTHLRSPVALQKAIKNPTEIANLKKAMAKDARALDAFYHWLNTERDQRQLTEWDCVEQLDACRAAQGNYLGPSFAAIVGHASHGAIVHYHPTVEESAPLADGLLLIDSGGQYLEGTTDITRTIALGRPTAEQKLHYTLVLQGLIALSRARFPTGTTGNQIEVLARHPLWQRGLNYGHGTGHGVGYLLNVHEGPQSFGRGATAKTTPLQPGMLITIEPGYYVPDSHGIRSENMVVVVEAEHEGYLRFATLTIHPIATDLVDEELMDESESQWLADYNARGAETLMGD